MDPGIAMAYFNEELLPSIPSMPNSLIARPTKYYTVESPIQNTPCKGKKPLYKGHTLRTLF